MLNIGWSEMLIIAAIALIVVGPKDLPAMLRQLGRVFGTVRRMGNEFKSEISKVAALDEIKDIKNSITKPLEATHEELTNQFNTIGKDGVEPSGIIKPKIEGQESVANEIRESAGLPPLPAPDPAAAASSMKAAITRAQADAAAKADAENATPAKKPPAKKRSSSKTAGAAKSTSVKKAPAKKMPAKRVAAKTAAKTTAAKTATTRKTTAAKTTAAKPTSARKAPAKKPAAAKEVKPITAVANKRDIPAKTAAKLQRPPAKDVATPKGDA